MSHSLDQLAQPRRRGARADRADDEGGAPLACRVCGLHTDVDNTIRMCPRCQRMLGLEPGSG